MESKPHGDLSSHALRNGAGVAVHLSELRPRGSDNGKGLVASGPTSRLDVSIRSQRNTPKRRAI